MSLIASTVLYAKEAGSGQLVPGAFPSETEQKSESQKEQKPSMDRLEKQGKTANIASTGTAHSQESKQPVEDDSWLKSLDELEAQPIKNTGLESFQETRHKKLSKKQLENYDDVDIMDAMERGEW